MVLISDGTSEKGAHVKNNFCYLICQGIGLDREQSKIRFFLQKIAIFPSCVSTCSELPSNISTMVFPGLSKFQTSFHCTARLQSVLQRWKFLNIGKQVGGREIIIKREYGMSKKNCPFLLATFPLERDKASWTFIKVRQKKINSFTF